MKELTGRKATYPFATEPVVIKEVRHAETINMDIVYFENGALMNFDTIKLIEGDSTACDERDETSTKVKELTGE